MSEIDEILTCTELRYDVQCFDNVKIKISSISEEKFAGFNVKPFKISHFIRSPENFSSRNSVSVKKRKKEKNKMKNNVKMLKISVWCQFPSKMYAHYTNSARNCGWMLFVYDSGTCILARKYTLCQDWRWRPTKRPTFRIDIHIHIGKKIATKVKYSKQISRLNLTVWSLGIHEQNENVNNYWLL